MNGTLTPPAHRSALLRRVVMIALCVSGLAAAHAETDTASQNVQLAVTAADKVDYTFGTLRRFVRRMKARGQTCGAAPYDHGIDIDCRTPNTLPMVYLHFEFEPGPNPRVAYLASLRINGRNGGEAPRDQWLSFMRTFTDQTPRRGDF